MVFILYKIHNDTVLFTGAYDNEQEALNVQANMRYEDNHFSIADIPYIKYSIDSIMSHSEEDNNLDEEDYDTLKNTIINLKEQNNNYKNSIYTLLAFMIMFIISS